MRKQNPLPWLSLLLFAGAAVAHQGVKDPQVQARMDAMSDIAAATKVLGEMARGTRTFDAETAQRAAVSIAEQSARVPDLFRIAATDPMSEALPEIWENFEDFTERTRAMEEAARRAVTLQTEADLTAALASIGETCKSCHKLYRE